MVTTSDRGQLSRRPRVSRPTHWDEVDLKYECLGAGGKTLDEIGAELSVTREAVRQHLLKLGVSARKERQPIWFVKHHGLPQQLLDISVLEALKGKGWPNFLGTLEIPTKKQSLVQNVVRRLGLNLADFRFKAPRVERACEVCGKVKVYRVSAINQPNPLRGGRAQEHFFCSRSHYAKWAGGRNLGKNHHQPNGWTRSEEDFLRSNYQQVCDRELAIRLEQAKIGPRRTLTAVRRRRYKLGLVKS